MTSCEYYISLISAGLDNELTAEECSALTEHLSTCPRCRYVHEAFTAVSGAIADTLEDVPESLHENVMAEVRRIEIKKKNRKKRMISTFAACAAIIILGGIGITSLPVSPLATGKLESASEPAVAAAPAAASYMIAEESARAMEYASESPAEYSTFSVMADTADAYEADNSFFDLRGYDTDEFIEKLLGDETEFNGDFDRCVELIVTHDGTDEDIIVYITDDNIISLSQNGNYHISALSIEDFELFVLNHK